MRSWYLTQMTDHEERVFSFEFPAKFLSIDVQDVHKLFIENLSAIFVKFLFIVEELVEPVFSRFPL